MCFVLKDGAMEQNLFAPYDNDMSCRFYHKWFTVISEGVFSEIRYKIGDIKVCVLCNLAGV